MAAKTISMGRHKYWLLETKDGNEGESHWLKWNQDYKCVSILFTFKITFTLL